MHGDIYDDDQPLKSNVDRTKQLAAALEAVTRNDERSESRRDE